MKSLYLQPRSQGFSLISERVHWLGGKSPPPFPQRFAIRLQIVFAWEVMGRKSFDIVLLYVILSRITPGPLSVVLPAVVVSSESLVLATRRLAVFSKSSLRMWSVMLLPIRNTPSARLSQLWMWRKRWRTRAARCTVLVCKARIHISKRLLYSFRSQPNSERYWPTLVHYFRVVFLFEDKTNVHKKLILQKFLKLHPKYRAQVLECRIFKIEKNLCRLVGSAAVCFFLSQKITCTVDKSCVAPKLFKLYQDVSRIFVEPVWTYTKIWNQMFRRRNISGAPPQLTDCCNFYWLIERMQEVNFLLMLK